MKKNYLFIAASFLAINSFAQPTLTGTQLNPVIGEVMNLRNAAYTNHGTNGSNQTWDFSSMPTTASQTMTVIPSTAQYPGTNQGHNAGGGNILYAIVDATQQAYKYQNAGGVLISFTDPQKYLTLPLSSSTNTSDAFEATFTNGGVFFTRAGSTNFEYVGYGTITTPYGTFPNSIKLHVTQSYTDTYTDFGGGVIDYEFDGYYWYAAGIHQPIFSILSLSMDGDLFENSVFFQSSSLEISENIAESSVLFPNPTTNDLNFAIANIDEAIHLTVVDLNGSVVSNEVVSKVNDIYSISVQDLNPGIYFAEIELADGSIARKKFQKI